jgi:hypothetical protein
MHLASVGSLSVLFSSSTLVDMHQAQLHWRMLHQWFIVPEQFNS